MIFNATAAKVENDHRLKLITSLGRLNVLQPEVCDDLKSELENWPSDQSLVAYLITHLLATESDINQAYALIYNLPFINLPEVVDIEAMKYIPRPVCVSYKIIPYKNENNVLSIAVADPLHIRENKPGVLSELKGKTNLSFSLSITSLLEFERWISQYPENGVVITMPKEEAGVQEFIVTGFVSLIGKVIDPALMHHLPLQTIKYHRVVVYDYQDGVYLLAAENPSLKTTQNFINFVQQKNNIQLKLYQTDGKSIDDVITKYQKQQGEVAGLVILHEIAIDKDVLHRVPYDVARNYHVLLFSTNGKQYNIASDRPEDPLVNKICRFIEEKNHILIKIFKSLPEDFQFVLDQYETGLEANNSIVTNSQISQISKAPWKVTESNTNAKASDVMPSKESNSIIITSAPTTIHSDNIYVQGAQPNISPGTEGQSNSQKNEPKEEAAKKLPTASAMADSLAKKGPGVSAAAPVTEDKKKPTKGREWVNDVLGFLGLGKVLSQKIVTNKTVAGLAESTTIPIKKVEKKPEEAKPPAPVLPLNDTVAESVPVTVNAPISQPPPQTQPMPAALKPKEVVIDADADNFGKMLDKDVETEEELKAIINEGFVPKSVAALVSYAISTRASDIHIESESASVRVRFRIDGILKTVAELPFDQQSAIASRIKIMSKLKIDETRIPQDGRFEVAFGERAVDLRVSCMPTVHGEKIVMRILDKSKGIMTLEDLGVIGRAFTTITEAIGKPFGIVLSTGPTGSGKSTTLYAILNRISTPGVNAVTLEDPVEYEMDGVNQSQIKPKIGYTFAEGLRSILRQDPNIIMVGEIRDNETAAMATHAALTGHLVLSTLHTNDAAGALPRMMNMGVEPFLLTSSINAIEAQRLVRKICSECKEEVQIPGGVLQQIEADLDLIPQNNLQDLERYVKPLRFYKGRGCAKCQNGYKGRIGIYEVMPMSEKIEELAISRSSSGDIQKQAILEGMITMKQDGLLKALAGLTTIDEVLKETSD